METLLSRDKMDIVSEQTIKKQRYSKGKRDEIKET